MATQSEFRAIEDRLRIQFGFGWASGDPDLDSLAPGPARASSRSSPRDRTYSEFAFHPDYRVDLILFRNILTRVQGAYYFRPSVEYDFTRDKNGQKLGGGAAVIWSRASEFIQTPGHARDLGVELERQALLPVQGRHAQRRPATRWAASSPRSSTASSSRWRASATCPASRPTYANNDMGRRQLSTADRPDAALVHGHPVLIRRRGRAGSRKA